MYFDGIYLASSLCILYLFFYTLTHFTKVPVHFTFCRLGIIAPVASCCTRNIPNGSQLNIIPKCFQYQFNDF